MVRSAAKPPPSKGDGSGKKRIFPLWVWLALILGLVLVVGTVLAFFLFTREKTPDLPDEVAVPLVVPDPIPGLWRLPVMQVSVRVEGDIRLPLRLGLSILAADHPDAMVTLLRQREAILEAVRDYLEKGRVEDWENAGGKLRLKYALTAIVNRISGEPAIRALYITDYTILWPI